MRITVGDTKLFFDVEGAKFVPDGPHMRERPSVITIHGGPGFDHSSFKPLLSDLTDIAQVIYFDQRGHGRSDHGTAQCWNLDMWAEDVRRLCETLDIEHPIILGESFNPALVQFEEFDDASHLLLREHPDKVLTRIKRFIRDVAN